MLVKAGTILRAQDLREQGIAGTTIRRALNDGELLCICRGFYENPDQDTDSHLTLAEIAKRIPQGVIAKVLIPTNLTHLSKQG